MKKLLLAFICLSFAVSALAQADALQSGSVVVGRYGEGPEFIAAAPAQAMQIPKWRFSLDAAYSYRTAKTAEGLDAVAREFADHTRNGFMAGGGIHYFFGECFGLGLQGEGTFSSYSLAGYTKKINVSYIGPSCMWRGFDRRDRNSWNMAFSLGYFGYTQKDSFGSLSASGSEGGVGSIFEFGYDIRLGEGNTFLGLRFSFFGGSFLVNDKSVSASGKDEYEGLNAIRIGGGLRF